MTLQTSMIILLVLFFGIVGIVYLVVEHMIYRENEEGTLDE